ncbi:MAG: rhs, partial [Chlamydiia bacterium]|nr:rhs [Chlamydiia bacterium]
MRILSSLQFLVIILFYTVTGSMQAAEPLSPFEVIPQAIVGECVDTTSGMYFEQEEDVAISSINELALKRTYTSEWGEWRFFPHCTLVHGTQSQTGKELIHTFDSNGTPLQLIVSSSNSTEYLFKFETPIQNAARGILTGRAHFSDCKGHVNKDLITLQLPDGAVRTYEKFSTTQPDLGPLCAKPNHSALSNTTFYRLTSEQLPSQNILRYRYNRDGYLQAVDLIDSREKLYASITFQYQENQAHAFVNDQLMVSYSFQNGLLSSATRIKKQSITYTYEPVGGKRRLVKKEFPEGRSIHLSYTADGKVAAITPSGYTVPLYQFEYSQNATNVIHSNKSTTRYTYKDRLLSTIEFSDGLAAAAPDKRKDTFIWNAAADEANVHTLKGCTLRSYQNNNSKIAQAIRYEYQKNENASIVQQDVYKIPLLDHTSSISLDAKGLPTGKNKNRLTSSFSRTRPWQLRSQEDEHGTTTTYSYFGNSNHIKKILITKNNKVQHRQFFKYDETTGALLKTIVDDGSKKTSNELDDITTRHIKTIKQKWSWRRGDYLEQIDEFRYDPISQKEYLTATVKQTFDSSGNLLKRELVDTEGATAKVEEFAYDIHDNCIREVNALGETTHYHFDTNDNCIQVQRPGLITLFTYDLANRPSTTKECYDDGYTVTTRNIYNDQENCIERVDRYGNTTKYKYDASSRCRSIIHPRTRMYASGALNTPIDNFIYDIFG